MLTQPQYQQRATRTLAAIEDLVRTFSAPDETRVKAVQLYAAVRILVDDLRELVARDADHSGGSRELMGTASESVYLLLTSCRALAALDESRESDAQHKAWALGAVHALRGPHAFNVRG